MQLWIANSGANTESIPITRLGENDNQNLAFFVSGSSPKWGDAKHTLRLCVALSAVTNHAANLPFSPAHGATEICIHLQDWLQIEPSASSNQRTSAVATLDPTLLLKNSSDFAKPSLRGILGSHPNSARAFEMSGQRRVGSSSGNG
jgi:hypothetical protein